MAQVFLMEWVILTPTSVVVRQSISPPTLVAVEVLEVVDQADGLGAFKVKIQAFCKLHISIIPMAHCLRDDFVYLYT